MGLPAHTNTVGWHVRNEQTFARKSGRSDFDYDGNYENYDYVHYWSNRANAVSHKPTALRGDKVTPLPYWRHVMRVLEDAPMVERSTLYSGGGKIVYDESYETYHSAWREPFTWYPWDNNKFQNAHDESVVKALNHLGQAKAQLGAEIAMIRQTADMFAGRASQLAGVLLAAKRGRWGEIPYRLGLRGRNALTGRTTSSTWLELQYGWLPWMQTVRDTQSLVHYLLDKPKLITGSGKGKYETESEWDYDRRKFYQKSEGKVRTSLTAKLDSQFWHGLDSAGLLNPATIAWELVPWSFAIDWFVPVGATLEALTATAGLSFVRGHQSSHHQYKIDIKGDVQQYPYEDHGGYSHGISNPGAYTESRYEFRRWTYDKFPRPVFYADVTPFSTPRVLNALSLYRQLFR